MQCLEYNFNQGVLKKAKMPFMERIPAILQAEVSLKHV